MSNRGERLRISPAFVTCLLGVVLISLAVGLSVAVGGRPLLSVHLPWAPIVVAFMFAASEAAYVSVEFRRQAYSFTVAGIPLVLGLLACPVWSVITARVVGAAIVLGIQRLPALKLMYNLAAFAFETALAGALLHAVGVGGKSLTLPDALLVYGTLLAVDLLMSGLVLILIGLHGGEIGRREAAEALMPAAAFNAVSLAYALVAVVLLNYGPLGWVLLGALSTIAVAAYRAHTVLAARHESLAQISDFVGEDVGNPDVASLAGRRISRVRELLRAGFAHAVLDGQPGEGGVVLTVNDADELTTLPLAKSDLDWLSIRVRANDEAILVARATKDPALRRWLADRGVRDAIIVPVTYGEGMRGTLTVTDRMADHASFTADDVTLLKTLAGHLGVALRSTRLLERLRHDATHDILTGLANRALLQEALTAQLSAGRHRELAVLMFDLDGFKDVNDALGHEVGDRLLQIVGQRLVAGVTEGSMVARLGGDEFAVLLPHPEEPGSDFDPDQIARELADAVAAAVSMEEATLSVEASVGVATTRYGATARDLLRHADTAMYSAKAGGQRVQRYTPELDRGRGERLALVADLRLALERDELVVLFQPKVDLATRELTGAEALVRWQHPRLGLLSPDVFIPIAESTGLIEPLTQVVLRVALAACRSWRDQGLEVTVAVNLSARNVTNPELPAMVARELSAAGLPPRTLVLEITESSVMGDPEATVPILQQLKASGVALSLDDFGTGYSSLAYLQRLPVSEVKIDKSFVIGLSSQETNQASEALIRSIVGLGKAFRLRIVAEGVEDALTLGRLAELGCHDAQGYHLGHPRPAEDLPATAAALGQAGSPSQPRSPRLRAVSGFSA